MVHFEIKHPAADVRTTNHLIPTLADLVMGHPTALMLYVMMAILYYQLDNVGFSCQYERVSDAFKRVSPSEASPDTQDSIGSRRFFFTTGLLSS